MTAPLIIRQWQFDYLRSIAKPEQAAIIDDWIAKGFIAIEKP